MSSNGFEKQVLSGEVMFSNLRTPVAFMDGKFVPNETEGNFDISIKVSAKDAEKITKRLDALDEKNFQAMVSTLSPAAKRSAKMPEPKYKEILDEEGAPTGELRISVRRKAKVGAPKIYDSKGDEIDVNFLPKGTAVDLHVSTKGYAIGGKVGTAYYMNFIKVTKEVDKVGEEIKSVSVEDLLSDTGPKSTAEMPF